MTTNKTQKLERPLSKKACASLGNCFFFFFAPSLAFILFPETSLRKQNCQRIPTRTAGRSRYCCCSRGRLIYPHLLFIGRNSTRVDEERNASSLLSTAFRALRFFIATRPQPFLLPRRLSSEGTARATVLRGATVNRTKYCW